MNISEEDIRNDENAKDYIDLTHIEMPLPVNDFSEYKDPFNELYKHIPKEDLEKILDFVKTQIEEHIKLNMLRDNKSNDN